VHSLQRRPAIFVNPYLAATGDLMPMLIGSTTMACTLLSMMLGQISMGMEALGVLLASIVLMSLQREEL
jgi:hypothetical protein